MNMQESANEVLNDARLKMSIATGKPVAVMMHVLPLNAEGQPEGLFTVATFTPQLGVVMPIIQNLIQTITQQGARIDTPAN